MIVDAKVYDLSKFATLHPGGLSVLLDNEIAGKDVSPHHDLKFCLRFPSVTDMDIQSTLHQ